MPDTALQEHKSGAVFTPAHEAWRGTSSTHQTPQGAMGAAINFGKFVLGGICIAAFYKGIDKMRVSMHVAYAGKRRACWTTHHAHAQVA